MKPCHAALLAVVGWYLMVPPLAYDLPDLFSKPAEPLAEWNQVAGYDTAKECESAKAEMASTAIKNEHALGCGSTFETKNPKCYKEFTKEDARCIASDDPRLKQKP
jgi:hypothetical protein